MPAPKMVALLLAAATVILVFRLPGAVILSGLLPVVAICLAGAWRPRPDATALWVFFGLALGAGALAQLFTPSHPMVNFATLGLVFAVFAFAVLGTGAEISASRAVMRAMYYCFGATLLIGWGEVLTGFKLQRLLYPDSAQAMYTGRFYVAAYFPNYNDFGVVVAMFSLMAISRFFFDPRGAGTQVARAILSASGLILIVGGGSRGALAGLGVGLALLLFINLRLTRPRLLGPTTILAGLFAAASAALVIWSLPAIQDNSTQVRGEIVADTVALSMQNPATLLFGWGNNDAFQAAASDAYPGKLMDPHNLLLEVFVWYGLPTLLAFVALWLVVTVRGIWHLRLRPGWTNTTAVVLFALTPVLGIVPSSSLRYYYVFLLAACAVAAIPPNREALPCAE